MECCRLSDSKLVQTGPTKGPPTSLLWQNIFIAVLNIDRAIHRHIPNIAIHYLIAFQVWDCTMNELTTVLLLGVQPLSQRSNHCRWWRGREPVNRAGSWSRHCANNCMASLVLKLIAVLSLMDLPRVVDKCDLFCINQPYTTNERN